MPTARRDAAQDLPQLKLLPIVSVTLTQSEWDALGKHGMSALPVTRRLVILGHIVLTADTYTSVLPTLARKAAEATAQLVMDAARTAGSRTG